MTEGRGTASGEARRVRREESRWSRHRDRPARSVGGPRPAADGSCVGRVQDTAPPATAVRSAAAEPHHGDSHPILDAVRHLSAWATGRRTRSRRFEGMSPLPARVGARPAPTPRPRTPLPSRSPPSPHSTQSESRVTQAAVLFPKMWEKFLVQVWTADRSKKWPRTAESRSRICKVGPSCSVGGVREKSWRPGTCKLGCTPRS